ncbi:MAG: MFS transporter, partial [Anaerolineae bacterium]|nr:MFS transporter [Anaerolineae bacterium]
LADIFDRRRMMLFTQLTLAMLAALLAWVTLHERASIWLIYAIVAMEAAAWSFDLPARQSLIPNLLPRESLTNAFSMMSIAFQVGSIVGPAAGGVVLTRLGIGYAYLLNALTYLTVNAALVRIGPVPQAIDRPKDNLARMLLDLHLVASVSEGFRFVIRQPIIFSSMLLDFLATFFSSATALLPIFAKEVLGFGAIGYGWLTAAPAIGALIAAAALSFFRRIQSQGPILLLAVFVFGLATL